MNPRKPHREKAVAAGISLPRPLIERAKQFAHENGFAGLSSFTRWLLSEHLAGNQHPSQNNAGNIRAKARQQEAKLKTSQQSLKLREAQFNKSQRLLAAAQKSLKEASELSRKMAAIHRKMDAPINAANARLRQLSS